MASITITLSDHCGLHGGSGGHLTFTVTGDVSDTVAAELIDVTSVLTEPERVAFIKGCVKLGKIGRTNAQLRTLFTNGVTVTV